MSEMTTPLSTSDFDATETIDDSQPESTTLLRDDHQPSIVIEDTELSTAEALPEQESREVSMTQFFDQSYSNPEVARSASASLIDTFDDNGLWLSGLIQSEHLVIELRQQCSLLTKLVVNQWVRQGETHKLKTLGEALLNEEPSEVTHESTRIMSQLAGILGILRPQTAQRLLKKSCPQLVSNSDLALVHEAQQWVDVGHRLEKTSTDERVFWNRRLREPNGDWDWDSPDARSALKRLNQVLPRDGSEMKLIQRTVPGSWWDLWLEQQPPVTNTVSSDTPMPLATENKAATRRIGSFTLGLVLGVLGMACAGWFAYGSLLNADSITSVDQSNLQSSKEPTQPMTDISVVNEPQAPPIRESLSELRAVLKMTPETAVSASLPKAVAEPVSKPTIAMHVPVQTAQPNIEKAPTIRSAKQPQAKEIVREKERLNYVAKHPEVKRLHSLVKGSSLRENESIMQGRSSVAPSGSPIHQNLLHLLILDPPDQADMRLAATKFALRRLPTSELVSLFDTCLYSGSPNELEVRQCASLLLELPGDRITENERKLLSTLVSAP
ncbi:MAG: hypothetical protein ABL974_09665 [Prosthecobacter sp.]